MASGTRGTKAGLSFGPRAEYASICREGREGEDTNIARS